MDSIRIVDGDCANYHIYDRYTSLDKISKHPAVSTVMFGSILAHLDLERKRRAKMQVSSNILHIRVFHLSVDTVDSFTTSCISEYRNPGTRISLSSSPARSSAVTIGNVL